MENTRNSQRKQEIDTGFQTLGQDLSLLFHVSTLQ